MDIKQTQERLSNEKLDGWLLYDFRNSNPLARKFLKIGTDTLLTRRFFYWIPSKGTPVTLISEIEKDALQLPGEKRSYRTSKELEAHLKQLLQSSKSIAMEVSANPYLSKVDGGTLDLVRSAGVKVTSSGNLLTSTWDEQKIASHLAAADFLDQTAAKTWYYIKTAHEPTEWSVTEFILNEFQKNGFVSDDRPICAVNEHSANPHYAPSSESSAPIKKGDFILIDLWCKQNQPDATYGDITRVGVFAEKPTPKQQEIFSIVKEARDAATNLVKEKISKGESLSGFEVDRTARQLIAERGYGNYFIHRLGHNIDTQDHGDGAHLDSYETEDTRQLLAGTCFSIEPGIYLPGEFGVRLEYDVLIHPDRRVQVTGGVQDKIVCLLSAEKLNLTPYDRSN